MSFRLITALMRRRLPAVIVVLIIAGAAGYGITSSPPMYSESGTVVFTARESLLGAFYPYSGLGTPLTATEAMLAADLMSPPGEGRVRAAGGSAHFEVVPFNTSDLEYPDYAEPFATVTTTSPNRADTRRTFGVVLRLLGHRLAAMQAGVPARNRMQTYLAGDSGAISEPGSHARVLAGLTLLAVMAVFTVASFLDRRRLPHPPAS